MKIIALTSKKEFKKMPFIEYLLKKKIIIEKFLILGENKFIHGK